MSKSVQFVAEEAGLSMLLINSYQVNECTPH